MPVPYVEAVLELPLFGRSRRVTFLVDTGGDATVINPQDSQAMLSRDSWPNLRNPVRFSGAGAGIDHFPEPAVLGFTHNDGRLQLLEAPVFIAMPSAQNANLESILGRDLLVNFVMTFDPAGGVLTFE
jgi:hypothetical protein